MVLVKYAQPVLLQTNQIPLELDLNVWALEEEELWQVWQEINVLTYKKENQMVLAPSVPHIQEHKSGMDNQMHTVQLRNAQITPIISLI